MALELLDMTVVRPAPDSGSASVASRIPGLWLGRFIGAVANLAIQYNFSSLSIAVVIMSSHCDAPVTKSNGLSPDFPEPPWAQNALLGAVFAGAAIGMVVVGAIGDAIGRHRGMILTQALVVGGTLGAALCTWGPPTDVYIVLAICRFICGVGIGGIYPMSAAISHEAGEPEPGEWCAEDAEQGGRAVSVGDASQLRVGWAFFWQTPGAMLPYACALPLLAASVLPVGGVGSCLYRFAGIRTNVRFTPDGTGAVDDEPAVSRHSGVRT